MVQIMEKAFSQLRLADLRCALRDTRCSLCVHCDSPVATTGHIGWLIGCQVGKEESAIYCQLLFIDVIHLFVIHLDEEKLKDAYTQIVWSKMLLF